ncbi:MAG: helix-turn-helix transcriptional regulator [Albidovulum sp.]|uniref:helix-turn-helix transcriptional regulator n=1 Tax=Albidovulum sp. TaxID=1872424 RepID=UPI003CC1D6D1
MSTRGKIIALTDHAPATESLPLPVMERLGAAIGQVGSTAFPALLADVCKVASGFESAFVCAFFPDHAPVALFDDLRGSESAILAPYLSWAYLLDPLHGLYREGGADCAAMLADIAPDDFRSSEYFRRFYAATGLDGECGVILRDPDGAAIVISLGVRNGSSALPRAAHRLRALLPVLGALTRRQWPGLSPGTATGIGRVGGHVERAFALFGTSRLSEREAEVARLIVKGHSNKSIARLLGNSPETVKVHRKRIHAKLGITSAGGLFSLFMAALSATPPGAATDPLTFLPDGFRPAT